MTLVRIIAVPCDEEKVYSTKMRILEFHHGKIGASFYSGMA